MQYKYTGELPVILPTLHKRVEKGDVIPVDEPIHHPNFKEVKKEAEMDA